VFNNLGLLKTPCKRVKVSFAHHQSRDYSKYTAPMFRPSGYSWQVTHFCIVVTISTYPYPLRSARFAASG